MASRSVNKVILIGNLGKDAESKFTPNGTSVATFSIATSWRQKDQQTGEWTDQTDWHNIKLWKSENVVPYLTKGTQVYVEGRLHTRSYEKDGKKPTLRRTSSTDKNGTDDKTTDDGRPTLKRRPDDNN